MLLGDRLWARSFVQEKRAILFSLSFILPLVLVGVWVRASGGLTFQDIVGTGVGLVYERAPSPDLVAIESTIKMQPFFIVPDDLANTPAKPGGAPGVALLDYDNDGDTDIYVPNGPNQANSLFSNQLQESGQLSFVDVATSAGIDATAQDSTGVCYGDIDNDGDEDVYVVGRSEANRLFENDNGSFTDISASSGTEGANISSTTCSFGDINADGLLDLVVSNTFDWLSQEAIFFEPVALNAHDELFLNLGGNAFQDVSATSGIQTLDYPLPPQGPANSAGTASISWSIAMVDIDQDGDIDIVTASDQGGIPAAKYQTVPNCPPCQIAVDRGFIHIFKNDGTGQFTDMTEETDMFRFGAWMSLAFADFDCDGNLDIFGSNLGDYVFPFMGLPYTAGDESSRWLLQQTNGTFLDPGVGALGGTPFCWGNGVFDYDNDADTDLLCHGSIDLNLTIEAANPGALLESNGCSANFSYDAMALANSTDHMRRNVQGVGIGDLNNDGFADIVTASNVDFPAPIPLIPAPPAGSVFDLMASFVPVWLPTADPSLFTINAPVNDALEHGTLSVELNSADNGNKWVKVKTLGTIGITSGGTVNRDGIGAIIKFTPKNGDTVMQPILSGGSYSSQHSRELIFGLKNKNKGTLDVLWPGGVRNRLDKVKKFKTVVLPEIPCSYAGDWEDEDEFEECLDDALDELKAADLLTKKEAKRFRKSMNSAFEEFNDDDDDD